MCLRLQKQPRMRRVAGVRLSADADRVNGATTRGQRSGWRRAVSEWGEPRPRAPPLNRRLSYQLGSQCLARADGQKALEAKEPRVDRRQSLGTL